MILLSARSRSHASRFFVWLWVTAGRSALLILLLLTAAFSGCTTATLTTQNVDLPSGTVSGLVYYVPIGKITMKGEFKELDEKGSGPKPDKTAAAQAAQTPAAGKGGAQRQPPAEGGGGGQEAEPPSGQQISVAQLTISITAEEEADESLGAFYVTPRQNSWYEDEVKVGVNAKHLLSTGAVTTEDKTVEIVGTVTALAAKLVAPLTTKGRPLGTPSPRSTPAPKTSRQPFYFSFHPSDAGEVEMVRTQLRARGIGFRVTPRPNGGSKTVALSETEIRQLGSRGLVFRPAVSYKIRLKFDAERDPKTTDTGHLIDHEQQFIMPDPNRLYVMEYSRMPFVKKVKEAGFKDGMLTEFHAKTPSPIVGFLGIPKALIEAVVPIPGGSGSSASASSSGTGSSIKE